MKPIGFLALGLALIIERGFAQSLGDLARKERERKSQEQKASVQVSTDQLTTGKLELSPPLDTGKKGDLEYLLQQLAHPKPSPELLAALIPLKDRAVPKLVTMLENSNPFRRIAPATALTVLGRSDGLVSLARLLTDASKPAAGAAA